MPEDRSERVQTPRNAWINRVRDEALRMRRPEVSKAAQIGVWIATYADADGSNAFPSQETLAAIAGCTDETVTRCVKLLVAVGLLSRKRRPNKSAVYQLLIPAKRPDWEAHLHVWGESRQARARRKAKELEIAELLAAKQAGAPGKPSADTPRNPSQDGIRNPSPAGVPEPVPGGIPNASGTRPRTPPNPVPGRLPEPVPGGGDQYIPTYGRDPHTDHDAADHSPQPQTPAGARDTNPTPPATPADRGRDGPGWIRCAECGCHVIQRADRPPRTHCHTCQPAQGAATA